MSDAIASDPVFAMVVAMFLGIGLVALIMGGCLLVSKLLDRGWDD